MRGRQESGVLPPFFFSTTRHGWHLGWDPVPTTRNGPFPLARALLAGGVRVLEVTLRTPPSLEIASEVPDAVVGVGTITKAQDFAAASEAGARFGVNPGLTSTLADAARSSGLPLLPGVMTPTDVIAALAAGFQALKLFPAQQGAAGGRHRYP